ncbi:MAG: hypothetical protein AAFV53_23640 [Myxococcota bacterium]
MDTSDQALYTIRRLAERTHPRQCPCCHRVFPNLRAYLTQTSPLGVPISYDAELGDWQPSEPIGTIILSNCRCGTTLSISTEGMALDEYHRLMRWARTAAKRRHCSMSALLDQVREQIVLDVIGHPRSPFTAFTSPADGRAGDPG